MSFGTFERTRRCGSSRASRECNLSGPAATLCESARASRECRAFARASRERSLRLNFFAYQSQSHQASVSPSTTGWQTSLHRTASMVSCLGRCSFTSPRTSSRVPPMRLRSQVLDYIYHVVLHPETYGYPHHRGNLKCPGGHQHVPLQGSCPGIGSLTEAAAAYQPDMRKALKNAIQLVTELRKEQDFVNADEPTDNADALWIQIQGKPVPVLTRLHSATRYMAARVLVTEGSQDFIQAAQRGWIRIFGPPQMLQVDSHSMVLRACETVQEPIKLAISPGEAHERLAKTNRLLRRALDIFLGTNHTFPDNWSKRNPVHLQPSEQFQQKLQLQLQASQAILTADTDYCGQAEPLSIGARVYDWRDAAGTTTYVDLTKSNKRKLEDVITDDETEEPDNKRLSELLKPEGPLTDYWEISPDGSAFERVHVTSRRQLFCPSPEDPDIPYNQLGSLRHTEIYRIEPTTGQQAQEDRWRNSQRRILPHLRGSQHIRWSTSGEIATANVKTIHNSNKALRRAKANADVGLMYERVTDNQNDWSLVAWSDAALACRKIDPGSESQAAAEAADSLTFAANFYSIMMNPNMGLEEIELGIVQTPAVLVVDATALYDLLDKQEEKTSEVNGKVRWVSSERQLADGLTKMSAGQILADRLRLHWTRLVDDGSYQAARKKTPQERKESAYQYAISRAKSARDLQRQLQTRDNAEIYLCRGGTTYHLEQCAEHRSWEVLSMGIPVLQRFAVFDSEQLPEPLQRLAQILAPHARQEGHGPVFDSEQLPEPLQRLAADDQILAPHARQEDIPAGQRGPMLVPGLGMPAHKMPIAHPSDFGDSYGYTDPEPGAAGGGKLLSSTRSSSQSHCSDLRRMTRFWRRMRDRKAMGQLFDSEQLPEPLQRLAADDQILAPHARQEGSKVWNTSITHIQRLADPKWRWFQRDIPAGQRGPLLVPGLGMPAHKMPIAHPSDFGDSYGYTDPEPGAAGSSAGARGAPGLVGMLPCRL
ncbi:unnamed protein product [Effrenium voratum]|uniref:Uncharacterized protein n=1 Tax=Effrenium voratum TaxID=2562239 RepID=A0AA36ND54_9DINO|nr:unnamed protein product [Effrenium voratum]